VSKREEWRVKTAFLYTDRYGDFDYGANHPLKIERLRLTYELCRAFHLFDLPQGRLVEAAPATESEVLRFHTPAYVEALKGASEGRFHESRSYGLGPGDNPVFSGLWEWSLLHTGATLEGARLVSEGAVRTAFNIAGGLHHAAADRASGFCYVNDPVLAIYHFLDRGKRILYLDIDAHHGDGVQDAFYEDPRALTVSFHQEGRSLFPGTGNLTETGRGEGAGFSVNVPMLPGTDDAVFLQGFSAIVPRLLETYRPDVVVSQLGVDASLDDPLAGLELTTNGYCEVISFLTRHAGAWLALGGGGYDVGNVARAWTLAWAVMNGVDLPEEVPESLIGAVSTGTRKTGKLRDPEHRSRREEECARHMHACVRYLEETVFPIGGL